MMSKLDAIQQSQQTAPLDFDELMAVIAEEQRGDGCEFEELCRQELAAKRKPGAGPPKHRWRCGWLVTDVNWCAKRRLLVREVTSDIEICLATPAPEPLREYED